MKRGRETTLEECIRIVKECNRPIYSAGTMTMLVCKTFDRAVKANPAAYSLFHRDIGYQ